MSRFLRPRAIAYAGGVTALGLFLSLLVIFLLPGDAESKAWNLYSWRLVQFPATLALGALSLLAYDRFVRIRRRSTRGVGLVTNAAIVALIPYLALLAWAAVIKVS
jgi:hypothetical protein